MTDAKPWEGEWWAVWLAETTAELRADAVEPRTIRALMAAVGALRPERDQLRARVATLEASRAKDAETMCGFVEMVATGDRRIAELEAETRRLRDLIGSKCASMESAWEAGRARGIGDAVMQGAQGKRIAELEAENARLREGRSSFGATRDPLDMG